MLLTTCYKPSKLMFHFLADMLEVLPCAQFFKRQVDSCATQEKILQSLQHSFCISVTMQTAIRALLKMRQELGLQQAHSCARLSIIPPGVRHASRRDAIIACWQHPGALQVY